MKSMTNTTVLNYLILFYAASIPFSLDLLRIFAPLILIVWLAEGDLKKKFAQIAQQPLFKAFGALIGLLTLSLIWTDPANLKTGIKYITRFWYVLPMFAIYTSLHKRFVPHVVTAFLVGMCLSVCASYLVYFHIIPFEQFAAEGASPMMHHTLYSIFLTFTIGIVLLRALTSKSVPLRWLYSILFILFTVNLFINIGRAGQILFPFIVATVILTRFKVTFQSVATTLLLAVSVFTLAFTLNPTFQHKMELTYHNLSHVSYSTSLGARIGLNEVAEEIITAHPLIGVGAGDYLTEKAKIVDAEYPDRSYVRFLVHYHDQYAEFAVIAGVFALLVYLWLWVEVWRIPTPNTAMRTLKYLFLVTFVLTSCIDAMFHLNRPLSLFALFAGLLLAHARQESATTTP